MLFVRKTLAAALVLGATALGLPAASGSAAAMPLGGLAPAVLHSGSAPPVEQVRWVCNPWRCHWAPNYYGGYYGGPRYGRPHFYGPGPWGYGPRPYPRPHRDWGRW